MEKMSFKELGLGKQLLKAISDLGFETPTDVQREVIPHLLNHESDLIGLAQTGTGKTAAFGLPLLEKIEEKSKAVQVLILCPTRELCLQITRDMENFTKYRSEISILAVYGGAGIVQQIDALRRGIQVVVATPGRLLDLIKRKAVNINKIRHLVLDEADVMLSMGFKDELDAILETAPKERQTSLFSATMTREVERIAKNYMHDAVEVTIGQKNTGIDTIDHIYYTVHAKDKYLALKRIVDYYPQIYSIVFCRTRTSTQEIADKMIKDGYNAEALHGDLSQAQRELVMSKFRNRNLQLLFATDIAARGLDVTDLTHVIHYDLPDEIEIYTHRSGRTGRAGKTGLSVSIINMREKQKIKRIEQIVKRPITEARIPLGKDICAQQLLHLIDKVKAVQVDSEQLAPYMSVIEEKLAALDREALLQHFLSLEFNRFLDYYKNMSDLATVSPDKRDGRKRRENGDDSYGRGDRGDRRDRSYSENGFTYLTLNLGKNDRMMPPQIIGLINEKTRNRSIKLGRIDIDSDRCRIQVENDYLEDVVLALDETTYKGRKLKVEVDEPAAARSGNRRGPKREKVYSKSDKGYGKEDKKRGRKRR
jgi:ATP-dependent RNA helicase DeaD